MRMPQQAKPVVRTTTSAAVSAGVSPSLNLDLVCTVECGVALATCIVAPNPVTCLINSGMSKCIKCLH